MVCFKAVCTVKTLQINYDHYLIPFISRLSVDNASETRADRQRRLNRLTRAHDERQLFLVFSKGIFFRLSRHISFFIRFITKKNYL